MTLLPPAPSSPASSPLVGVAHDLTVAVAGWERAVFAVPAPDGWSGPSAEAARGAHARLLDRGGDLLARAQRLAGVLADVARTAPQPLDAGHSARLLGALVAAGRVGPGPVGAPVDGPSALAAAHWWAGLGTAERERLTVERPELVGALDGLPGRDRDRANRLRLALAQRAGEAEAATARRARECAPGLGARLDAELRLVEVRARLGRLAAVEAAAAPGHELLALDPGQGRAVVSTGDVDGARHVGVFVPGFTAGAGDLPDRLLELDAVAARAGPDTVMVAWYDYAAPQWSEVTEPGRSVLGTGPATEGGRRLAAFVAGLDVSHSAGGAHVTALGHSYGSLTVAQALPAAPGIDDVVLLGSPGVTPAPVRPGRVWVAEARGDPVADAGWFGPDPNLAPQLRGMSTDAQPARIGASGTPLPASAGSRGHSEYLRPGSTSAEGVAAVVAGRAQDVVPDRTVGAGDRLRAILGGDGPLRPGR